MFVVVSLMFQESEDGQLRDIFRRSNDILLPEDYEPNQIHLPPPDYGDGLATPFDACVRLHLYYNSLYCCNVEKLFFILILVLTGWSQQLFQATNSLL